MILAHRARPDQFRILVEQPRERSGVTLHNRVGSRFKFRNRRIRTFPLFGALRELIPTFEMVIARNNRAGAGCRIVRSQTAGSIGRRVCGFFEVVYRIHMSVLL